MLVNAVSTKSAANQSFGRRAPSREELEVFANADDKTLRSFAVNAASESVNDKKHRRISNAIWYSLPIAGGLASVVRNPKVIGRIPKLKVFAKSAALWAGTFAVIDATFAAKRAIDKNSSASREFNKEHPVLSTIATVGAAIGALFLAGKGATKLWSKYGANVTKYLKNHKVDKYIKENKLITSAMKEVRKLPPAIKNFAKGVIDWSPMILVFTSIAHTFNHEKAKAAVTARNYTILKTEQQQVRDYLDKTSEVDE